MFLLVQAYPGSPGQKAVKRLCVCVTYLLTSSYLVTGLDWLTFSKAEDLDISLKPSERL